MRVGVNAVPTFVTNKSTLQISINVSISWINKVEFGIGARSESENALT
jgi:hypothetical protein